MIIPQIVNTCGKGSAKVASLVQALEGLVKVKNGVSVILFILNDGEMAPGGYVTTNKVENILCGVKLLQDVMFIIIF